MLPCIALCQHHENRQGAVRGRKADGLIYYRLKGKPRISRVLSIPAFDRDSPTFGEAASDKLEQ